MFKVENGEAVEITAEEAGLNTSTFTFTHLDTQTSSSGTYKDCISLSGVHSTIYDDDDITITADKLTLQCGGDEYEGGKLAVERIERALEDGVNFTQETTLSGGYPKRLCKRAKEAGYYIRLYYVGLDTAEESIRRIRNRVERGGHDIPVKDVEARFSHRFEDVLKVLPYCDEAKFFDNDNGFVLVAEYRNGQILPVGTYRPAWLSQLLIQST